MKDHDASRDLASQKTRFQLQKLGIIGVMPTVLRYLGFRFYFYSHEPNEPPHIHVDKDSSSAKFWIGTVILARNRGFNARELNQLERLVSEHQTMFLEAWNEYFGDNR